MDLKFKIILIGDMSIGKTSAIYRFCEKQYGKFDATVGCDIRIKLINLDNEFIQLEIWDTAGQEKYDAVSLLSYRNIKGIILMYDITKPLTFDTIRNKIKFIQENIPYDVVKVLVGNKCDKKNQRKVTYEAGLQLAREFDIPFFETSSKANINIDEAFNTLTRNIRKLLKDEKPEIQENIKLGDEEKEKKHKQPLCNCNVTNNRFVFRNK